MESARLVLGSYTNTTDPTMTAPPGPVVGGDGSVDDGSDATYVATRAQRPASSTQLVYSSFQWFPEPVDLPAFDDTLSRGVDIRIRLEMVSDFSWGNGFGQVTVYQNGPLASYFGPSYPATATRGWSTASFSLSENRWNEFREGLLEIGAFDPTGEIQELGPLTERRIHVYEIEYTIWWQPARRFPAPCRRYPRADGRGSDGARIWPLDTIRN